MIEMKKDSFDFHQTFQPQRVYLAQILKLAAEEFDGTKEEISKITGIPTGKNSGKVVPHIKYSNYMGLIIFSIKCSKYKLGLTKLGREVYKQDPLLSNNITKLICHYNMCDYKQGAPQWIYLFRFFRKNGLNSFNINELTEIASKKLQKNVVFSIINKIYSSKYEEDNILSGIGLKENNGEFTFEEIQYNFEDIYVYAYALLDTWEKYKNDTNQITLDNLIDDLRWNNTFGINREAVLDILDELEGFGILTVNKQMKPIVIQRLEESNTIIEKLYEFCG